MGTTKSNIWPQDYAERIKVTRIVGCTQVPHHGSRYASAQQRVRKILDKLIVGAYLQRGGAALESTRLSWIISPIQKICEQRRGCRIAEPLVEKVKRHHVQEQEIELEAPQRRALANET